MWGHCDEWDRRHMVGANGDGNAEMVHTLCGMTAKLPVNYLRLDLEKCSKCYAIKKRKEVTNANTSNS